MTRSRPSLMLGLLLAVLVAPTSVRAQGIDGSTLDMLGSGGLGVYSGATLGLLGGMLPCGRTPQGRRCVVTAASTGAALGLAMGGMIGSQNRELFIQRAETTAWGVGIGTAVGLGLSQLVDQFDWYDVGTAAFLGGALGAVPEGALLGLGVGAVAGSLFWLTHPSGGVQDLVLVSLAGIALGGMLDWADAAARKRSVTFGASLSVG